MKKFKFITTLICVLCLTYCTGRALCLHIATTKLSSQESLYSTTRAIQNQSLQNIINELEDMGFEIYIDIPINESLLEMDGISHMAGVDEKYAAKVLEKFKETLAIYTDDFIEKIPKKIYLYDQIIQVNDDSRTIVYGEYIELTKSIFGGSNPYAFIFSVQYYERNPDNFDKVIHHELFHFVEANLMPANVKDTYKGMEEACGIVSGYACTDIDEEMSEFWAAQLTGRNTQKGEYLVEQFSSILRQ